LQEMPDGLGALTLAVQGDCKIEPGLMILGICGDFLLKLADRPDIARRFGEIDSGSRRRDRRIVDLVRGHQSERLPGAVECTGLDVASRKTGKRLRTGRIRGKNLRI